MIRRLRIKFVLINMSIVAAILAAVFFLFLSMMREGIKSDSMLVLKRAAAGENVADSFSGAAGSVQIPYFTVDVYASGQIVLVNGGYYALDDADTLRALVAESMLADGSVDTLKDFNLRFYRQTTPFGVRIAYADVSLENRVVARFIENALLLGGGALIVFLGISILLAHWAVKPVSVAWNQQKQFVEDASHELRTPLTVVMSNADMLMACPDADAAKHAQWIESIKSESIGMRALVEEMLTLARIDTRKTSRARETADFSAAAADCLLQFEAAFYETHRQVTSDLEEGLIVPCSGQHLQRLVENLVSNAVKYGDQQGLIHVSLHKKGRFARMTVANTGEPIPPEQLKRIFERFLRLDEARRSGTGYGLGLAIAKSIAEGAGGRIWAESAGGWNRFITELPLLKPSRQKTPPALPEAGDSKVS